jgi:hypothetical protein
MNFSHPNFTPVKQVNTINMKNIAFILLSFLSCTNFSAQKDSLSLLPDQNPNFRKSRAKYSEMVATLTQNQGQTVQQTYKAIDDVQAKKERRELRISNRQERRMARIQSRGYYYGNNNNWGGFNNNWGGFNGFGGNFYQNYGCSPFGYNYNCPYPLINPRFNSPLNTALLGLSLWSIFGR